MPGKTSMAVAPAAGAGEPGSGSGETARHAAPRGAGRPSYELLSKYRGVLMGVQILLNTKATEILTNDALPAASRPRAPSTTTPSTPRA